MNYHFRFVGVILSSHFVIEPSLAGGFRLCGRTGFIHLTSDQATRQTSYSTTVIAGRTNVG